MAIYTYRYTRKDGTVVNVERIVRMSQYTPTIDILDADGNMYIAERVYEAHANMAKQWGYTRETADLPPIDYKPPHSK